MQFRLVSDKIVLAHGAHQVNEVVLVVKVARTSGRLLGEYGKTVLVSIEVLVFDLQRRQEAVSASPALIEQWRVGESKPLKTPSLRPN